MALWMPLAISCFHALENRCLLQAIRGLQHNNTPKTRAATVVHGLAAERPAGWRQLQNLTVLSNDPVTSISEKGWRRKQRTAFSWHANWRTSSAVRTSNTAICPHRARTSSPSFLAGCGKEEET
mmetsp:Transcript_7543/g.17342  ORF Transcript_7543/g.17342 Transcript_7543/m.17342 type:complete len:124 (-) Transcript_7543:632-1003(-)